MFVMFVYGDVELVCCCYDWVGLCLCVFQWQIWLVMQCIDVVVWKMFEQVVFNYLVCVGLVFFGWLEDEVDCVVDICLYKLVCCIDQYVCVFVMFVVVVFVLYVVCVC